MPLKSKFNFTILEGSFRIEFLLSRRAIYLRIYFSFLLVASRTELEYMGRGDEKKRKKTKIAKGTNKKLLLQFLNWEQKNCFKHKSSHIQRAAERIR